MSAAGRLGDDVRAGEPRHLHRVHTQSAAGPGYEHALAELHPADVAHGVQDRADRAGGDRGLLVRHARGNGGDGVFRHRDVLGVAADQAFLPEKSPLGAERLVAAAAVPAGAADVVALGGRDAVADAEAAHLAAGLDHRAGDLVAGNDRQLAAPAIACRCG